MHVRPEMHANSIPSEPYSVVICFIILHAFFDHVLFPLFLSLNQRVSERMCSSERSRTIRAVPPLTMVSHELRRRCCHSSEAVSSYIACWQ